MLTAPVRAGRWLPFTPKTTAPYLRLAYDSFPNAFISYGRADSKAFAAQLNERLMAAGLTVWFDFEDIPLGVNYQKQIDDGIEKADNFLFLISPHSVNSPYCGLEVELALKRGKRIIPLLYVEQISRDTWQQRNPGGTDEQWAEYQAAGKHSSFPNIPPPSAKSTGSTFARGWTTLKPGCKGCSTSSRGSKAICGSTLNCSPLPSPERTITSAPNICEHQNRSTSEVESGEAFRYAIKPVADIIFEALQDQVIDFYAPGFLLSRGTSQARDEVKAAQAATTLYKEGVAKLNEARINAGLPDLGDAGDVFKGEHNGELVDSDQNKEIGDDEVFRADSDN